MLRLIQKSTNFRAKTSNVLNVRSIQVSIALMTRSEAKETRDHLVLVNQSNGVKEVTLNNTKKRNVMSLSLIQCLSEQIVDNPSLRCLVIRSNGPVFSSGHDLKELTSSTGTEYHHKVFDACTQLMLSIRNLEVPVICEVNDIFKSQICKVIRHKSDNEFRSPFIEGIKILIELGLAAAAGCQLVAASDIVIASTKSHFSTPGASVGLFCSTPSIPLSRSVNLKTCAYMLMTGNTITAQEALQSGLVSRVVNEEELTTETQNVVNSILAKSKAVIALGKNFFYSQINQNLETAYQNGSRVMVDNLTLTDGQEGISAFIDKRAPQWSHSTQTYK